MGVVWAFEHFHLYPYGSELLIATDHNLLPRIFNSHKPINVNTHRQMKAEANTLQLSAYLPTWQRRWESSRFYEPESEKRNIAEDYVNCVSNKAVPKAMTL